MRPRDIDYAATAVQTAVTNKFGRQQDLQCLKVEAGESTITLTHGPRVAEGTRDNLLAAIRAAESYERLWEILADR